MQLQSGQGVGAGFELDCGVSDKDGEVTEEEIERLPGGLIIMTNCAVQSDKGGE